jgi:uncharacterized protein with von Willebrand factor type A (vWA) domain
MVTRVELEVEVPEGDEPGASREALLRRKAFERCDERDLAEMEPLLDRLARKLARRRSRRLVPAPRGRADPRRSFRRALATGGELVTLARRAHPIERPRLVLLDPQLARRCPRPRGIRCHSTCAWRSVRCAASRP